MVLVNAIYFKGDWASPYDPDRTNKMPFYSAPGVEVQVDMMHQKDKFRFTQDKDVQVLGMQYKSPDLVFYAFLPTERNGLEAFEKSLTGAKLLEYIAQAHEQKVIVSATEHTPHIHIHRHRCRSRSSVSSRASILATH
jgi:serpin B